MLLGEAEHFSACSERIYGFRFAILGSEPHGWGVARGQYTRVARYSNSL